MPAPMEFKDLAAVQQYQAENPSKYLVLYNNLVVDVADFSQQHPGGPEVFEAMRLKSIAAGYDDVGHSSAAMADLKKLAIGTIGKASKEAFDASEPIDMKKYPKSDAWWRTALPLASGIIAAIVTYVAVAKRADLRAALTK